MWVNCNRDPMKQLDQNLKTPAVITTMLDWSATFDRLCPTIGITKFLEMCLRPSIVHVLTSYRSMSVKFNKSTSRVHHMPGGGSQGALLGVLEYLVQCNNIDCVDKNPQV